MSDAFDLAGRAIIVTGGAGLLGREYVRSLADAGAHVVLGDIDAGGVDAMVTELTGSRGSVTGVLVDVTDEDSVQSMVGHALAGFGRIDGLVNNAALDAKLDPEGRSRLSVPFEEYPLSQWQRTLAVNLTGMFLCSRAVAGPMRDQRRGTIVNVSSTYGLVGPDQRLYLSDDPGGPRTIKPVDYSVSKAGVIGLTQYLAAYFADVGIRVNTLTPGGVRAGQDDEFVRRYAARTPLGRMAERREYCGALRFLLSDASSYMTGANLVVDGGWTAW